MTASRTLGDERGIARTLHGLGALSIDSGESEEASAFFEQALKRFLPLGERWFVHLCILGLAMAAQDLGRSVRASKPRGSRMRRSTSAADQAVPPGSRGGIYHLRRSFGPLMSSDAFVEMRPRALSAPITQLAYQWFRRAVR